MDSPREALYYKTLEANKVLCSLCPHNCIISENKTGICRVRENVGGKLYSNNYGRISAIAMDPIEKKPLYHFYPGRYLLSIGTVGCNFKCSFCQNYHIAQQDADTQNIDLSSLVSLCRNEKKCIGIAYTYNEPNVWYEYVLESAKHIKNNNLKNVIVSNGYISEEPLRAILPYIDAFNIDVKAFNEEYYAKICFGSLQHVKRSVEIAAASAHVEITTLIVPGLNDNETEITELAKWLASIKSSIPLHLTRYFPQYKMEEPPTPVETLQRLKSIADEFLDYVYVGNVYGQDNNTYCPTCEALLISRARGISYINYNAGKCTNCGRDIAIIG